MIHLSTNSSATFVDGVARIGIERFILENLSVMTRTKRFPSFVMGRGPKMSIETNSSGPTTGNSLVFSGVCVLFLVFLHTGRPSVRLSSSSANISLSVSCCRFVSILGGRLLLGSTFDRTLSLGEILARLYVMGRTIAIVEQGIPCCLRQVKSWGYSRFALFLGKLCPLIVLARISRY